MTRRIFCVKFKREAAQLVAVRGVSVAQASKDLDVHATVLRRWVREFSSSGTDAFPGKGQLKPDDEELRSLKREVAKLKAERDILKKAAAQVINADAPAAMAQACAQRGIPFVTLSTDYVFAGGGEQAWQPDDPTGPIGAYGRTKLAGEQAVAAAGGSWAVVRTSWVVSAHGNNFVKTMLRLGAERDALNVVADQIGAPTGAAEIARACVTIANTLKGSPELSGVYHFAGAPDTSWADFARAIFDKAGIECVVTGIPSSDYPTPTTRPLNSRMDCSSTSADFGIERPDWRESLTDILSQLAAEKA